MKLSDMPRFNTGDLMTEDYLKAIQRSALKIGQALSLPAPLPLVIEDHRVGDLYKWFLDVFALIRASAKVLHLNVSKAAEIYVFDTVEASMINDIVDDLRAIEKALR